MCCCQGPQVQSHHSHLTLPSLAQNNWTHRIQDPVTYVESPNYWPTFLSASAHYHSASPQHLLLICGHSFPSAFIVIFTNNWSVFSLCLTSSLESTPCFTLTASCRSFHLGLWSSYTYQFSCFHKFTTIIIHNSFTLSLPAQNVPISQILPTIGPLFFSWTDTTDSGCSPFFSISGFVSVPCDRLSWFLLAFNCTLISLLLLTYL